MINILTDSTADIPKRLCEAYQINVIPMYIQFEGKIYKDAEDIDARILFEKVKETGIYPTTSAPSPSDYLKFFDRDEPSIYIGVSSKLSAAFQNAQIALRSLKDKTIDLIDSHSFSTGYGQVVLQAAQWRNKGISFDELGQRIRQCIRQSRGIFVLDTLDYLYQGGRCSRIEHFVSSLLHIHPFLNILPDGTLGILQKVRGMRHRAVEALKNYFVNQLNNGNIKRIFLTHLECDQEVHYLEETIRKVAPEMEFVTVEVGCALAVHSGPKPLGIAFIEE